MNTQPERNIGRGGLTLARIGGIFAEAHRKLERERPCPPIRVEYYRFVGINHTVRLREGRLLVRLSDLFRRAPAPVLEALAAILLAKLYRRNPPREARAAYREYSNSGEMRRRAQASRRKRGRKLLAGPEGSRYHLTPLFDDLNREYFKGRMPPVRLGWSLQKSRRILGHFDPSHRSITLSRWLDHPGGSGSGGAFRSLSRDVARQASGRFLFRCQEPALPEVSGGGAGLSRARGGQELDPELFLSGRREHGAVQSAPNADSLAVASFQQAFFTAFSTDFC